MWEQLSIFGPERPLSKICTVCGTEKPLSEYRYRSQSHLYKSELTRRVARCNDCTSQYTKQFKEKNWQMLKRRRSEYYAANKERESLQHKAWCEANPLRNKARKHKSNVQRKGIDDQLNIDDIVQMHSDQDGLCAYCEIPLNNMFEVEHMQPLSRGGANEWWNIAIVCAPCNRTKYNRTAEELFEYWRYLESTLAAPKCGQTTY